MQNVFFRSLPSWAYDRRSVAMTACRYDARFSYCLSVPAALRSHRNTPAPLIVVVHGSERGAAEYRDRFADFAEAHGCIVLAPLFPVGIGAPGDTENYKFILHAGIRYDLVLLAMVEEVAQQYPVDAARFLLHGFSGGGHFAHRFFYLHPQRLRGVSIGAPGVVTPLDGTRTWWTGVADVPQLFGITIDGAALRSTPVQMVVGAEDISPEGVTLTPASSWWKEGVLDSGTNRIERMAALRASFERCGIHVRYDCVRGVAHEGWHPALLQAVFEFFAHCLQSNGHTGPRIP